MKKELFLIVGAVIILGIGYWLYEKNTSNVDSTVPHLSSGKTLFDLSVMEVNDSSFRMNTFLVDLNNDDLLDALLIPTQPSDFCGNGGCMTTVFANTGESFVLVGTISVTRSVYLGTTYTNGWRDIITGYSGGGGPSGYTRQQFNGTEYLTGNASLGPAVNSVEGLEKVF